MENCLKVFERINSKWEYLLAEKLDGFKQSGKSCIAIVLVAALLVSSCRKTDEQFEEALVGSWQRRVCSLQSDDDNESFWFYGEIRFLEDGRFIQTGNGYCKDSCYAEMVGPSELNFCTCQYLVQNGCLVVIPDGDSIRGRFVDSDFPYNTEIQIVKVTATRMVLESSNSHIVKVERSCFKDK